MTTPRFTLRSLFILTAFVCAYGAGWISTAWKRDKEVNNYHGRLVKLRSENRQLEEVVRKQADEIDQLRSRLTHGKTSEADYFK